jgi:hypothetical protein
MTAEHTDTWAAHAQRILAQNGHRSGQARRAVLELLDT